MKSTTTHALKEWDVAVEALEQGKTIMLLRKGGIREDGGRFSVPYKEVLLYPTYEHQKPELLKSGYADRVTPVESGWHPEKIRIGSWAQITEILPVSEESEVEALLPYHIWNEKMVSDRLKWKRREPLYVLLLRTYKLAEPREILYHQEYGGCRSWLDLVEPIAIADTSPVFTDAEYAEKVTAIRLITRGEIV